MGHANVMRHGYPELRELELEMRAARVDMAADVVDNHIENGSLTAAMFTLKTIGGYSEKTQVSTAPGQPLQFALSAADAAVL
jgi:hypothetical protein